MKDMKFKFRVQNTGCYSKTIQC